MKNTNTVECILNKVAAGFTVYSVAIYIYDGSVAPAPNGWGFDVEEIIAEYGSKEVYAWELKSFSPEEVGVVLKLIH